ncbi:MAG: metallophosphoesterase [Candidatus Woesearchaeota archaeon]|jgi:hypothetical protein
MPKPALISAIKFNYINQKMIKILAFTDLHSSRPVLNKIIKKSEKADIVVCAGDISWFENDLKYLMKTLGKCKVPVLMIHGNHESPANLKKNIGFFSRIKFLHKKTYKYGKYLFLMYGGGGFNYKDKEFEAYVEKNKKLISKHKKIILVTHAPPYGTKLDIVNRKHVGNKSIKDFIKKFKPALVISGHIHECEGKKQTIKKTRLINPGPEGAIIKV